MKERDSYRFSFQKPTSEGCSNLEIGQETQKEYYDKRSEKYRSNQPEFNGWGSKFSQVLRFKVIIEEIQRDLINQYVNRISLPNKVSMLDFGCGSGDLSKYIPKKWSYIGIDLREDVAGTDIYGGVDIFRDNITELCRKTIWADRPIYSVASGSLAFMEVPEVEKVIDKLLEISVKGVVFNLLDAKSDYMGDEPVVHVQRKRFFSYVFNKYCVEKNYDVRMRTDYFENEDFTIGIFKN